MAVVKVKQIKETLHKSIAYVTNPDKTLNGTLVSSNYASDPLDHARAADAMRCAMHQRQPTFLLHPRHLLADHQPISRAAAEKEPERPMCHIAKSACAFRPMSFGSSFVSREDRDWAHA